MSLCTRSCAGSPWARASSSMMARLPACGGAITVRINALHFAYPVRLCRMRVGHPSSVGCKVQLSRQVARLFDPEAFDPSKLTVGYDDDAKDIKAKSIEDLLPRKYTLTHSDVTGQLLLTIGASFNQFQLADWYTRLMRDEIVAEWRANGQISLHIYCHVSGGHVLLAPAALRNSIFVREMPLVLEAIRHGDSEFLAQHPELDTSTVWVHYRSSNPEYDRADCWGPLFYAASPMSRASGNSVPLNVLVPFTPHTLLEVRREPVEQCTFISP